MKWNKTGPAGGSPGIYGFRLRLIFHKNVCLWVLGFLYQTEIKFLKNTQGANKTLVL